MSQGMGELMSSKKQLFLRLRLYPHPRRRLFQDPPKMSQLATMERWIVRLRLSSRLGSSPSTHSEAVSTKQSSITGGECFASDMTWEERRSVTFKEDMLCVRIGGICASRAMIVDRCSVE